LTCLGWFGQVRQAATILLEKTKEIFGEMYLLNIEIVVYAIVGKVREVMIDLVRPRTFFASCTLDACTHLYYRFLELLLCFS